MAQDKLLADNQSDEIRCGDKGIFKGVPLTDEQKQLSEIAHAIYEKYTSDGKYILDGGRLIICQSNAPTDELKQMYPDAEINPLGDWSGGTGVDTGATNRKLGSDMADEGDFLHFAIDFAMLINYNEFANCTRLQENLCSLRKRMILWKKT